MLPPSEAPIRSNITWPKPWRVGSATGWPGFRRTVVTP